MVNPRGPEVRDSTTDTSRREGVVPQGMETETPN